MATGRKSCVPPSSQGSLTQSCQNQAGPSDNPDPASHSLPLLVFLIITALLCGALVMMIEVLGSRVIGPFFGASLFVWTSLIAVTLVGLALGYAGGGILADYRESPSYLYGILFLAGMVVLLIPFLKNPVLEVTLSLGLRLGALTASALLFGPALILLGCVYPYLIKIAARELRHIGRTVGLFYAISTLGSFIGTICAGFFFIAYFGINQIFNFIGGSLMALAVLYFAFFRKKPLVLLTFALLFLWPAPPHTRTKVLENGTQVTKIYEADDFYGNIKVLDYKYPDREVRELLVDGVSQGGLDLHSRLPVQDYFYYLQYLPFALNPNGKACLVIGLGPGLVPMWYEKMGIAVDVVDIDPKIFTVAEKYFGFGVKGEKITADARYFLSKSTKKYDYVILDVFNGENTPSQVLSRECLQLISRRMNPGGILGINLVGSVRGETFVMASVLKTLQEVFLRVEMHPTFDPDDPNWWMGNLEIFAHNSPALTLNTKRLQNFPFPPLLASGRDNMGKKFSFPPGTPGIVLTDNYNPLDYYNLRVREEFRRWILKRNDLNMLF